MRQGPAGAVWRGDPEFWTWYSVRGELWPAGANRCRLERALAGQGAANGGPVDAEGLGEGACVCGAHTTSERAEGSSTSTSRRQRRQAVTDVPSKACHVQSRPVG